MLGQGQVESTTQTGHWGQLLPGKVGSAGVHFREIEGVEGVGRRFQPFPSLAADKVNGVADDRGRAIGQGTGQGWERNLRQTTFCRVPVKQEAVCEGSCRIIAAEADDARFGRDHSTVAAWTLEGEAGFPCGRGTIGQAQNIGVGVPDFFGMPEIVPGLEWKVGPAGYDEHAA